MAMTYLHTKLTMQSFNFSVDIAKKLNAEEYFRQVSMLLFLYYTKINVFIDVTYFRGSIKKYLLHEVASGAPTSKIHGPPYYFTDCEG
jgi:hypothetical protein